MMSRLRHTVLLPSLLLASLAGCSSFLEVQDNSGASYAQLRGTVTRADGAAVGRIEIGVSCSGSSPVPFGVSTETDATGRFDLAVTAPGGFTPLQGNTFLCRVLTPLTGTPQAAITVSVPFSGSATERPLTQVTLVLP